MKSRNFLSSIIFGRYKRESSATLAFVLLILIVTLVAPSFIGANNLRDLCMNNVGVLLVAIGMTLVILVGQIDISVGSQFAVCTYLAGVLARSDMAPVLMLLSILLVGAVMGAVNGLLVAWLRMPSIVVTLALMVAWRDGLRWVTGGEWVQDLPKNFQWFGLGQASGQLLVLTIVVLTFALFAWLLRDFAIGRFFYAVGSDFEAARLSGINPQAITFSAFVILGALVGLAAVISAIRFSIVPSNAGVGLELKAIAAVVVGGTAITGGRGTMIGTLIGVALLGTIGTALTFIGINAFWEKAIQGAIILAAVVSDVLLVRLGSMKFRQTSLQIETRP